MEIREALFWLELRKQIPAISNAIALIILKQKQSKMMVALAESIKPFSECICERIGEYGFVLADPANRVVHISNIDVDVYPIKTRRVTTSDLTAFLYAANELFSGEDLDRVLEIGVDAIYPQPE